MVDDLAKISLTVYVSNFPSHLTVRELWNICGKAGMLVDVYIANRKNNLGQMFAFCRFIKVSNSESLITSLSNVWIGKLRLHANVARFHRTFKKVVSQAYVPKVAPQATNNVSKGSFCNNASSYVNVAKNSTCSGTILGCFKDFRSIANTRNLCRGEGFMDLDFKYLGGLWVLFDFNSLEARNNFLKHKGISTWFSSLKPWHDDFVVDERLIWLEIEGVPLRAWEKDTFNSIARKWGELLFMDDSDGCNRLSKRVCIKSSHALLVFATIMVSVNDVNYAIRVRELCSWTPSFTNDDSESDVEDSKENLDSDNEKNSVDSDAESVADLFADLETSENMVSNHHQNVDDQVVGCNNKESPCVNKMLSDSDPFGLASLINKKCVKEVSEDNSLKHTGLSMIQRLEETIKVSIALGLNMEGCGNTLVSLLAEKGDLVETKMLQVDLLMLRQTIILCNENYVVIDALWTPDDIQIRWITVYAPQNLSCKIALWSMLANLIADWDGILMMMGDFNEVREVSERYGSIFKEKQADIFNEFINNSSLIEIPLDGFKFTWTDKWGSKMSKLDRFLVSESFFESFPQISGVVLVKGIPDHRPILLRENVVDYGPTPFRFFHSWLEMEGFHNLVTSTWKNDGILEVNGLISFKKKLQNLKCVIREWIALKKADTYKLKKVYQEQVSFIDVKLDQGCANEEDLRIRKDASIALSDIIHKESLDLAQKAKIKWAIEGDENSQFFHNSLKAKRRFLTIRGILKDGEWIDDPVLVKSEFFSHFSKRFQQPLCTSNSFDLNFANPLSHIESAHLERSCSRDEIKRAVWDCGGDRAPGPDGFSFKFFTTFWDLVEDDVVRFVNEFFSSGRFPKGCNSSFITLIPKVSNSKFVSDFRPISLIGCQYKIIGKILANRLSTVIGGCISAEQSAFIKGRNILDGPFILNEVLAWYRKHKKGLMVFKVDFEKAFDSVRWDFLDSVMEKIGFGSKWRSWIHGCFSNARSSVLVNGSPTAEFDLHRGLRQGDPLSPFLFILAMEGLHALSCKAEVLGLFKGASFGRDNVIVSHLMYADDVIFLGECKVLGFPVGCNMGRISSWNAIIQKFSNKLSLWKARLLSVGGRLTSIKVLYFKWIWRFLSNPSDLWARAISSIYGFSGGVDLLYFCSRSIGNGESTKFWDDIWHSDKLLKGQFQRIYMLDTNRESTVANRASISNCHAVLRRCPRGGAELSQLEALQDILKDVVLSDQHDTWIWSLDGADGFSVASVRQLVDSHILVVDLFATRWNRCVPIKINVFMWRLLLNKLPSRFNLDRRGIDVGSILCPICQDDVESVYHLLFSCEMAKDLWDLLAKWWELDIPVCANISECYSWLDSLHASSKVRLFLEGAGGTLLWSIWSFRNRLVFSSSPPKKALLWDSIVSHSFLWISSRNPKLNFSWLDWLKTLLRLFLPCNSFPSIC
ncbi:putative RNA-directed DNA polymerase, eukaryota, reverse transcriptase zinc-binding domain protein [Tanacetum coccineum]